eukprot:3669830-Prymnesium_polylepis.1
MTRLDMAVVMRWVGVIAGADVLGCRLNLRPNLDQYESMLLSVLSRRSFDTGSACSTLKGSDGPLEGIQT